MSNASLRPEAPAIGSLISQIELALRLLHVAEPEGDLTLRAGLVATAKDAYRLSTEAMERLCDLPHRDRRAIQECMDAFRARVPFTETRLREHLGRLEAV